MELNGIICEYLALFDDELQYVKPRYWLDWAGQYLKGPNMLSRGLSPDHVELRAQLDWVVQMLTSCYIINWVLFQPFNLGEAHHHDARDQTNEAREFCSFIHPIFTTFLFSCLDHMYHTLASKNPWWGRSGPSIFLSTVNPTVLAPWEVRWWMRKCLKLSMPILHYEYHRQSPWQMYFQVTVHEPNACNGNRLSGKLSTVNPLFFR